MKTRSDFVSNSSSCSFVISSRTDTMTAGLKFFSDTFRDCDIPYDIGNAVSVSLNVKNKWFNELYESVHGEKDGMWSDYYSDWKSGHMLKKDPEEIAWDGIEITLDELVKLGRTPEVAEKVDSIRFQCEDNDTAGLMYIRLLYSFFERNMFCPDATDSERGFIRDTPDDDFILKLTTACVDDGGSEQ